jgi:hypothetical protein
VWWQPQVGPQLDWLIDVDEPPDIVVVALRKAIKDTDLSIFETEPAFFRSFPPDEWPADGPCGP